MSTMVYKAPSITIPNTGTNSALYALKGVLDMADEVQILADGAAEGNITIEVTPDGGSNYFTLQDAGADITFAAGDAVRFKNPGLDFRLTSSAAQAGADAVFSVYGIEHHDD